MIPVLDTILDSFVLVLFYFYICIAPFLPFNFFHFLHWIKRYPKIHRRSGKMVNVKRIIRIIKGKRWKNNKKKNYYSMNGNFMEEIPVLTHLFPIHLSFTPWKKWENYSAFWCCKDVKKGCIGNKWVNWKMTT